MLAEETLYKTFRDMNLAKKLLEFQIDPDKKRKDMINSFKAWAQ